MLELEENIPSLSDCSSNLSATDAYYDAFKSCDDISSGSSKHSSEYVHHFHEDRCSNCAKPRAIIESRNEAIHRVTERIKLISEYIDSLNAMTDYELNKEIKKIYRLTGKHTPRCIKVRNLLQTFIVNNKPDIKYRLAIKFYNYVVAKWKCVQTIEPEMEDVYDAICNKMTKMSCSESACAKIIELIHSALNNTHEPRKHKLEIADKIYNIPVGLATKANIEFKHHCDHLIKINSR